MKELTKTKFKVFGVKATCFILDPVGSAIGFVGDKITTKIINKSIEKGIIKGELAPEEKIVEEVTDCEPEKENE